MGGSLSAEKSVIETLLHANSEPMSLTGLKLVTNHYDMDALSTIVQELCLKGIVSHRNVSDSINGDCAMYYISRKQKRLALDRLSAIDLPERDKEIISDTVRQILTHLLSVKTPQTVDQLTKACETSKEQVSWRLQKLTRNEWVSARVEQGHQNVYFLNDEQAISAAIHCEKDPSNYCSYSQHALREAVNDVAEELERTQGQRKELDGQLRDIRVALRTEQMLLNKAKERVAAKKEKLKAMNLTKEQLRDTLGMTLSRSQPDPVLIAERLSFLKNLRTRPALEPLVTLSQIISDYEVALSITRNT